MSIAEKFEKIADAVYEKGVADGFVEAEILFTNNYTRKNYMGAFLEADMKGYTFKQTIYPITGIEKMFYSYAGTELPKNIDFSKLETNKAASYYRNAFGWMNYVTEIPDMGLPAIPYYTNTYSNCGRLKEIEVIRCNKNTVFQNPFSGCYKLTEFRIEGEIGTDFSCPDAPVSPETMLSVIDHLVDYSGTSNEFKYSVIFNNICWSALDAAYPEIPSGLESWMDYVVSYGWDV